MIVRLMTRSDFLFPDFCHELPVNMDTAGGGWGRRLLLEYPAHVIEEPGGSQHDRGWLQTIPAVQEELSVSIALGG